MNLLGLTIGIDRSPSARVRWTQRALVLAAANAAVVGTGLAYASWSATGTGSGTASTGSASSLGVVVTDVTGLYPLQKTTVAVKVTNPNAFPVTVSSITLGTVTPTGTGCLATDVKLDGSATGVNGSVYTPASGLTLAKSGATGDSQTYAVPIAAADLANACQGAGHSFSLPFTVAAATS